MTKLISILKLIAMALLTLITILICFVLLLLTFNSKLVLKVIGKNWAKLIMFILGAKLKTSGLNHINPNKTYIVLANHTSNLDIPMVMSGLPFVFYFVAKKEMQKIPLFGWIMTAVGMIFIDRGNNNKAVKSMRKAGAKIKSGKNVMIFPEGTFDDVEELLPFKKGAFHLAIHSGVEILPVALVGARKVWPVYSSLELKSNPVELRIGRPIKTSDYEIKQIDELSSVTRESIEGLLKDSTA